MCKPGLLRNLRHVGWAAPGDRHRIPEDAKRNQKPQTRVNTCTGAARTGFSPFSSPLMSTLSPTNSSGADDHRPDYQRERANDVHPNRDEPQLEADAGTPNYGDFGKPTSAATSTPASSNDGSNDNPDEFSEFDYRPDDRGTNAQSANPMDQRGHTDQNQDAAAVNVTRDAPNDERRAAWADDDERYAGGHAEPTWKENNDAEHSND